MKNPFQCCCRRKSVRIVPAETIQPKKENGKYRKTVDKVTLPDKNERLEKIEEKEIEASTSIDEEPLTIAALDITPPILYNVCNDTDEDVKDWIQIVLSIKTDSTVRKRATLHVQLSRPSIADEQSISHVQSKSYVHPNDALIIAASSGAEMDSTDMSQSEITHLSQWRPLASTLRAESFTKSTLSHTKSTLSNTKSLSSLHSFSNELDCSSSELDLSYYAPGEVENINPAGYEPDDLSLHNEQIFTERRKLKKSKNDRSTLSRIQASTDSSTDDERVDMTRSVRRGRPNPQKPIIISGQTLSEWKARELFGVFEFTTMDAKTHRPVYKRVESNTIGKDVYLFYRHESEKWCIGPNHLGSYCWIYCDSQSRLPIVKANKMFWFEHVGGGDWKNTKIDVLPYKNKLT